MEKRQDGTIILTQAEHKEIIRQAYFEGALTVVTEIEKIVDQCVEGFAKITAQQFEMIKAKLELLKQKSREDFEIECKGRTKADAQS